MEMNGEDMRRLGISEGSVVRVSSRRGSIDIKAMDTGRIDEGSVFISFHFAEAAANRLTIDALDPVAKIPEFKVAACRVEKI